MDSLIFQALAVEIQNKLANSRLDRVVQTTAGTFVLRFWTGREKVQLLLKADGQGSCYQSRHDHPAPASPPRFCQLLRARLKRLLSVSAEPLDRILHLVFAGADNQRYDLVLEAFGSRGNLLLTDERGKIVDLLWRVDGERKLLPGASYQLPFQQERLPLFGNRSEVVSLLESAADAAAMTSLDISPMSKAFARAIAVEEAAGRSFDEILDRVQASFQSGSFKALRVAWDNQTGYLPVAIGLDGFTSVEEFEDLSSMLEQGSIEEGKDSARDLTSRLAGVITRQRKKLKKRLTSIALEREKQADPEKFRIIGDLLLANLHRVKRGNASVEVDDYYQSPVAKVTIDLDTKLTPQENAERYFKLYRKAKRAGDHHQRRLQETEQEIEWLDQVELALEEAVSGDELYQVQMEMESAGLLTKTKGQLGRRKDMSPIDQLNQSTTASGFKIFWGKNSRTNDYVSRSLTGPEDLWFHAHGMPGCHLVLKCGENPGTVSDEDVLCAASYAAGYSKGKDSGKVEVIVAKGRDVKKPKGARPGLVTVDSYYSVIVAPRRLEE